MVDVVNISVASTTPGTNETLSGTSILGTGLVSTADDSFRNTWALIAKFYDDFGGVNTVGGTANAVTITTPTTYTALATGMRVRFVAGSTNTAATTLNLDAIGAKAVRKISGGTDVALAGGEIQAGEQYDIVYSTAANAAAGGWMLSSAQGILTFGGSVTAPGLTPPGDPNTGFYPIGADNIGVAAGGAKVLDIGTTGLGVTGTQTIATTAAGTALTITSTEAGATAGPTVNLYRDSATPAVNDILANLTFNGEDSAGLTQEYASIESVIVSPTSTTESGALDFYVTKAGVRTKFASLTAAGTAFTGSAGYSFDADTTVTELKITSTSEASLASTDHGFQLGPDGAANLIADPNEIQARNNGSAAQLNINPAGGDMTTGGNLTVAVGVALPAGGSTGARMQLSAGGLGIYVGSGAPSVTAAKGSFYMRSDGSSTSTRAYINTDGGTTWTAITTAA